jgi:hypothetical protein
VLVDAAGNRNAPHYRAIDIASDNRIPPGKNAVTTHAFALPADCTSGTVRAQLWYRPLSPNVASERGWEAKEHLIASATVPWP